jgi:cephalosporin hydroxylase
MSVSKITFNEFMSDGDPIGAGHDHKKFKKECEEEVHRQGADNNLKELTQDWIAESTKYKYSYHFEWLGRPIIQYPQDIIGVQQLLWKVKPDLIIETGIARGGSLIFYASLLELISCCGGNKNAMVLGVDIDIREHNYKEIISHPMSKRIEMIQGSSIEEETRRSVIKYAKNYKKILVCLDSNHTHDHVLEELKFYAPLVSRGSYCVVFDTMIADIPENLGPARPWGKRNNPKTAVFEFLKILELKKIKAADGEVLSFQIDKEIENQLLITVSPDGFLIRS